MIIAIDGPAGAGKSTTARALAERFGFAYIDTGAMYRAVALAASEHHLDAEADAEAIAELARGLPLRFSENGRRLAIAERDVSDLIRSPQIGDLTSRISTLPAVRAAVVARQQELARRSEREHGGAVLEGRDIQTVVFPDAEVKIFLTATPQTRSGRRLDQWRENDAAATDEQARGDIENRDARDSGRAASPLKAAADAVVLETDQLSQDEVVATIARLVESKRRETTSEMTSSS